MAAFFIATVYIFAGLLILALADMVFGLLYECSPRFRRAFKRFYRRVRGL